MEIFGIKFAPLNIPLTRRLQTLAAGCWFFTFAFGGFFGLFFAIYFLFTWLRWVVVLYLAWIFLIDRDVCDRGGRRIEWVRSWSWWTYMRDYFPVKLERAPWVELDPKKNYLFCCFPHGMLPAGPFVNFGCNHGEFGHLFPDHTPYVCSLAQHFVTPFFRELSMALGGISVSAKSLNWILSFPGGGKVAVLLPGGAAEAYFCRPGHYKVVLKNRKGFVKLAMKNGAPLVPVVSFGETDLFDQPEYSEDSKLHRAQEWLRKMIGIAPAIPLGRGFFQYTFGLVPHRKPITTVVGRPIEVEKNENPTSEQVDKLHVKFVDELGKLFEEQKRSYLKNPDATFLVVT